MTDNNPYQTPAAKLETADAVLTSETIDQVVRVARRQRAVVIAILVYILVVIINLFSPPAVSQWLVWPTLVIGLVIFIVAARLYWAVYNKIAAVAIILLSLIPLLNLLFMASASSRATRLLREHGLHVGFLGVNAAQLTEFKSGGAVRG
ncbi:MAG: hypothetical protein Tsb002_37140 [Wenzhouxiangellaceae bacterium]